jgi:hypothetical protein
MNNPPLSWRSVYATYRFCGHGRIWSAWSAWRYLRKFGTSKRKPNKLRLATGVGLLGSTNDPPAWKSSIT